MTPRRRQGSGRAAIDHITAGLTDALSTLSKVTVSQAVIAEAARDNIGQTIALVGRLDDELLAAVLIAARTVETVINAEQHARKQRGGEPDWDSP